METASKHGSVVSGDALEFVTFCVGDLLVGVNTQQVQEINRHLAITPVPQTPDVVRGAINLRGEVVTVVDLRGLLELEPAEPSRAAAEHRIVIVDWQGERIGLLVDRIADVVRAREDEIEPPPANVQAIDGRHFKGVYRLESELLVILNVDEALAVSAQT